MTDKNKSKKKQQRAQVVHAKKDRWDNPAINTTVHVLVGTISFLIVATAAFGIDLYVHWMTANGASGYTAGLLEGFAHAILTLDVAYTLWFMIKKIAKEFGEE